MIRFYKYLLIICVLFGCLNTLKGQKLDIYTRQAVNDNYTFKSSTVNLDNVQVTKTLQKELQADLINGYVTAGYDSIVTDSISVRAYYTRGNKFTWEKLSIKESELILKSGIRLPREEDNFNISIFSEVIDQILQYGADNGFPFASVKLDSLLLNDSRVTACLVVDNGERFSFDTIIVKGDSKIKPYYINKIIEIEKGDEFSMSKISQMDLRIKTIPFVEQTRPYQLAFADGKTDILLYLKNKKASRFSGLIGILPNNKTTGKVLITGDVNLNLLNSIGYGELFMFKWQKFESNSQNLKTEISVPYLFKSDFGPGVRFDIEKKDSSYVNTDFTGRILYGSNTGNGFELFYRRKSSYLLIKEELITNSGLTDYSTNLYGISYRLINTDNLFNPRKGIFLSISTAFGTKTSEFGEENESETVFQTRNSFDFSVFLPIGRFISIKIRNNTASIYSKSVSTNEFELIGGLNTIRGFDELSLPATSFSVQNFEFRYLFEEESALFAFFDAAYFEKRFTLEDSYNYAMGIGVGIDLNTGAGTFSLVYAIGKQNENSFNFNNSKIHFGYRNSF